ncbi:MAG: hypothetical protein NVS9B5_34480 [Terriglobales bacterium]
MHYAFKSVNSGCPVTKAALRIREKLPYGVGVVLKCAFLMFNCPLELATIAINLTEIDAGPYVQWIADKGLLQCRRSFINIAVANQRIPQFGQSNGLSLSLCTGRL